MRKPTRNQLTELQEYIDFLNTQNNDVINVTHRNYLNQLQQNITNHGNNDIIELATNYAQELMTQNTHIPDEFLPRQVELIMTTNQRIIINLPDFIYQFIPLPFRNFQPQASITQEWLATIIVEIYRYLTGNIHSMLYTTLAIAAVLITLGFFSYGIYRVYLQYMERSNDLTRIVNATTVGVGAAGITLATNTKLPIILEIDNTTSSTLPINRPHVQRIPFEDLINAGDSRFPLLGILYRVILQHVARSNPNDNNNKNNNKK